MSVASMECLKWLEANTETDKALDWLLNAPIEYLLCRKRHPWPELVPGPLPAGVTWEPAPEYLGCFQITLICPRCAATKTEVTGQGGVFEADILRKYAYPEGYGAPKGAFITPTQCATEIARRRAEWEETHNVRR